MKKLFKEQIEGNQLVDSNMLAKINGKDYFNGESIKIGDRVLFALLKSGVVKEGKHGGIMQPLKIITLKEEHFNLFEFDNTRNNSKPPVISLKDVD